MGTTVVRQSCAVEWALYCMSAADKIAAAIHTYHTKKIAKNFKLVMQAFKADEYDIHHVPNIDIDSDVDDYDDYNEDDFDRRYMEN